MKKILIIFTIGVLFFLGCSEKTSITNPETQSRSFISLSDGSLNKITDDYVEKSINGDKGGIITFRLGILLIPKGAFEGTKTLTISNDNKFAAVDFGPSMQFNKPLQFTIHYTDLNLSGIDPDKVDFGYMDGNKFEPAVYQSLRVDVKKGSLTVIGAEIHHFSRYGFTR